MKILHSKLKNGLNFYIAPMKGTATTTVLVLFHAGSKYENKQTNGLSHFLEHMFFKGTVNRPTPLEVTETLDRIGGEFNAFTDKERTGYYAKVDASHLKLAIDWVSDMLLNPLMKKEEIEREKGVIHQEINMYYDTPMQYVDHIFESLLYGDQPAGWDIAGSKQTVSNCTRRDLLNYFNKRYTAQESTVIITGNINQAATKQLVNKYFSNLKKGKAPKKPKVKEKQKRAKLKVYNKDTDQTHLILGVRAFNARDKRRHTLAIMSTILGGYMSSRLFMSLREKYGLAYYVACQPQHYSDTGYLATHAGVPNQKVVKAVEIIMAEYNNIRDFKVRPDELIKAKDYIRGKIMMGLESSNAMASFVGDQALMYGKVKDIKEIFKKLEAVTAPQIQKVAETIFKNNHLNLALIGPKGKEKELRKVLKFTK